MDDLLTPGLLLVLHSVVHFVCNVDYDFSILCATASGMCGIYFYTTCGSPSVICGTTSVMCGATPAQFMVPFLSCVVQYVVPFLQCVVAFLFNMW